jgi:glycosyltransferase involved in cell wall biosynthesis
MSVSPQEGALPGGRQSQASQVRLSVVISAYAEDRWSQLCDAVYSVLAQSDGAVEVLVVVDHNPSLLERVKRELAGAVAIPNREARGLSGARNSGIAAANGEIIVFLDDDARAEPGWLERLLAPYETAAVIAVGGRIEPAWVKGRPGYFPEEFDWVVGCTYKGMPSTRAAVRNVIGANMSFRREAFQTIGNFPHGIGRVGTPTGASTPPFGCEETELCIRIRQRLAPRAVVYEPGAVVTHRVPPSRASVRYFVSRCLAEGRSKALVAQIAGRSDALETERWYMRRVLPAGIARSLGDAARGDLAGLRRAAMIATGAGVTTLGYLLGTIALRWRSGAASTQTRASVDRSTRGLELAEVTDERVLASLARIDEMSDAELRELVRSEPAIVVEAAEGVIASRRTGERQAT